MKIGLLTVGLGKGARPAHYQVLAEHCERLGFGTLWAPEHVVLVRSLWDRSTRTRRTARSPHPA